MTDFIWWIENNTSDARWRYCIWNIVNDDIDDDDIARPRIVKIVLSDISGDVRGLLEYIIHNK